MKIHDPDKFVYKKYDKRLKNLFLEESKKLKKFLPKNCRIEHIGSTAVPGLGGKGIIDILVLVDKKKINKIVKILIKKYNHYGVRNGRHFFDKTYKYNKKKRFIHIHLTHTGSHEEIKSLNLVRYLRKYPEEARKYAKIKNKAVKYAKGNRGKYLKYKSKFLEKLNKKALREQY